MTTAELPDDRCGFSLQPADVQTDISEQAWPELVGEFCCYRKTWDGREQCIWHTDCENKPVARLREDRADGSECLDGAILDNVVFADGMDFEDCRLIGARFVSCQLGYMSFENADMRFAEFTANHLWNGDFSNTQLRKAMFSNSDLRGADFTSADLWRPEFKDVQLRGADFHGSELKQAKISNSSCFETEFSGSNLSGVDFTNTELRFAEFQGAGLTWVQLSNTDLWKANFSDSNVMFSNFNDANLRGADFQDAVMLQSNFTGANLSGASFERASLHNSSFSNANCTHASFLDARIYETDWTDTRISSGTTFSVSEKHSKTRPLCIYETAPDTEAELPKDVDRLEAAQWVYRRLEALHENFALSDAARDFHISKEEAERKQYAQNKDPRWLVKSFMWYTTKHGESIQRLLGVWVFIMLVSGVSMSLLGGVKSTLDDGPVYALSGLSDLLSLSGWQDLALNLYFSIITFSTIGYGDLAPAGPGTRVIVAAESLAGALLLALLIFVMGRRVER